MHSKSLLILSRKRSKQTHSYRKQKLNECVHLNLEIYALLLYSIKKKE